jgi:hypothetical protein
MKNRVYNGPFGKIVRTLGFVLVLVGSAFYLSKILIDPTYATLPLIGSIAPYGQLIDAQLAVLTFLNSGFALIALILGFILIVFAIRRGVVVKTILTAALLIALLMTANLGSGLFAPIVVTFDPAIANILGFGDIVLSPLLGLSPYVAPGVFIGSAFLIWVVFAYKRPKRISTFFVRVGATTLFLAMAMQVAPALLGMALLDIQLYFTGVIAFYVLSYATFAAGSAFGIVGFLRK